MPCRISTPAGDRARQCLVGRGGDGAGGAAWAAGCVVLDEGANWKGAGTALHLAEAGHEVTIVTPAGMVAKEVARTEADIPIRKRLRELGARFITDAAMREWHGDAAVVTQFAGADEVIAADTLVIAACNRPEDGLAPRSWPIRG